MIQWFSKNEKRAVATIYSTNITINKAGTEMMGYAYAAMVGLDKDDSKVAVQPIGLDEYEAKSYPEENMLLLSGGKAYTRISSTDFVARIGAFLGHDFKEKPRKYDCYFDQHEGLLIIDLKKEVA